MAAPVTSTTSWSVLVAVLCLNLIFLRVGSSSDTAFTFKPQDILEVVTSSCLVALPKNVDDTEALHLLSTLSSTSYGQESRVVLGKVDTSTFLWPNGNSLTIDESSHTESVDFKDYPVFLIFKRVIQDRTCLLIPKSNLVLPSVQSYHLKSEGDYEIENVVDFVNLNCETFRRKDGSLSYQGIHRNEILNNLYLPPKVEYNFEDSKLKNGNSLMSQINSYRCESERNGETFDETHDNKVNQYCAAEVANNYDEPPLFETQHCQRISLPSTEDFLSDYLFKSKPVIIEGATQHWPALKKWTNQYLRQMYEDQVVHIKITPSGEYEGVEKASLWDNKIKIPKEVLAKLPYPDLVVVRPATMEIPFSKFLDIVEDVATKKITNMSAYLEYSSVKDYFPELRQDFDEMSFFKNVLTLRHINMWLSDGNTVGKLHFDPYDNFMSQISGEKEFIIYDPHENERLYEAHIQEAMLSYNKTKSTFARQHLLDSTSMVMSPVDIEKPDFQRFPRFAEAVPMSCKIKPGDVLYMPAFWWHEVKSSPNITERRNLAINFWYEPFLQKEFPCAECRLDVNPLYFNML